MITVMFLALVVVIIVLSVALRRRGDVKTEQVFGLNELRAALGIDSNVSPRSLRAIVVGALGYSDRVAEDIAEEKRGLNEAISRDREAVSEFRETICEIERRVKEEISVMNNHIAARENNIDATKNDLSKLEDLESRIDS